MINRSLILVFVVMFAISACSPSLSTQESVNQPTVEAVVQNPTMESEPESPMTVTETPLMDDMPANTPAWFAMSLTDVRTGDAFTLNDHNGKVILVENLAMWCSNCKKQQTQVKQLHELLAGRGDFISIGLDIDTNENAADLKTYIENNGFDWTYAIASAEMAREISDLYGAQFLNPPSTPILIIDRNGIVHPMPFGIKSADELYQLIEPFLSASM